VIELGMVGRRARRGALLAPLLVVALWIGGGPRAALSAGIGVALALGNLWFAGRVIGGVAENSPQLLMAGAILAFGGGLAALTGVALALRATELVSFPVTGLVLIGTHLGLVLWEAARAFPARAHTTTEMRS
jgi:hypothetical protein